MVLDLRTVESAFTGQNVILQTKRIQALHQSGFGFVPSGIFTDTHGRTRGHFVGNIVKTEGVVHLFNQLGISFTFGQNLIFGTENMAVILREASDAHQTMQRARRFIAVALTEFTDTHRQIAIAAQSGVENLNVTRAVHGL